MIFVKLLTIEEYNSLAGKKYNDDSYFNPILDLYERWVLSLEEVRDNIYPEFKWINDIPEIEYIPKPVPPPI